MPRWHDVVTLVGRFERVSNAVAVILRFERETEVEGM